MNTSRDAKVNTAHTCRPLPGDVKLLKRSAESSVHLKEPSGGQKYPQPFHRTFGEGYFNFFHKKTYAWVFSQHDETAAHPVSTLALDNADLGTVANYSGQSNHKPLWVAYSSLIGLIPDKSL